MSLLRHDDQFNNTYVCFWGCGVGSSNDRFLKSNKLLDWQEAAQQACEQLFPQEVIASFVGEMQRVRPLLAELGYEITVSPIPVAA